MIKPGKTDICLALDVAHRSGVITLISKDTGRSSKDELKLLIISGWELRNCGVTELRDFLCGGASSLHATPLLLLQRPSAISRFYNLTYSNSNGLPLIPAAGGAIQFAIFPGSVTGCIKLRTYSRSLSVGIHSDLCFSNSSFEIRLPWMSNE